MRLDSGYSFLFFTMLSLQLAVNTFPLFVINFLCFLDDCLKLYCDECSGRYLMWMVYLILRASRYYVCAQ